LYKSSLIVPMQVDHHNSRGHAADDKLDDLPDEFLPSCLQQVARIDFVPEGFHLKEDLDHNQEEMGLKAQDIFQASQGSYH
jgi:hypothetical protein